MPEINKFLKECRLLCEHQFREVLAYNQPLKGRLFVVYPRPNTIAFSRLGLIVSKKNCRLSVLRNRLKRHVREFFRLNHKQLKGYDIVVVARHKAQEAQPCELRHCLDRLFKQLAMLGKKV